MKKLKEEDYEYVAEKLGIEVAVIKAVERVETGGRGGFLDNGEPVILFEGHIFWRELKKLGIYPADYQNGYEEVLYEKWEKGHYRGGIREYERLNKALEMAEKIGKTPEEVKTVREAAYRSASYGKFQIMGLNAEGCGYRDIWDFLEAMRRSEGEHLNAFAGFILKNRLDKALRKKDWACFAKGYNGPGYAANQYDIKMATEYEKCRK